MFIRVEIDEAAAADIPIPANAADYVDVLGIELAVRFLLHFGGAPLYFTPDPKGRSELAAVVGIAHSAGLGRRFGPDAPRIPLAKPWIAAVLRASGAGTAQIARQLRVTDVTVARWLG
jgi:hypothetical protein